MDASAPARRNVKYFLLAAGLYAAVTVFWNAAGGDPPRPIGAAPPETSDPDDPYPLPPELVGVNLLAQTSAEVQAKSAGCMTCHVGSVDPHMKDTVRLGCTDCHGGDATATTKERAHVCPSYPQFWPTSGNPVRSYTLLNHENPAFIRFVNPGDFRVAHISCGTVACHPKEVLANRKQIMTTGCMLWGAAAYNNGAVPVKRAVLGEAYSMNGAPLKLVSNPPPNEEQMVKRGEVPWLAPLPRFEITQPGNVLRIFEPGGRFKAEVGIPERTEEPGRPRQRLSTRGLGTENRTDPVFVSATKTRLFDPTLNFLGTNDHPGDFRSSGCTACHVVYANDRSSTHSGPYAGHGNRGFTSAKNQDPTIPKNEPGHPIEHKFTTAIPTSQCMVCHVHPGTTVMNSYLGYMWWDEESEAQFMYPRKEKFPTPAELINSLIANPNESAAKGNHSDEAFLDDIIGLNPYTTKAQFGDFHSHGWVFRAVYKKDRQGNLIDHFGDPVGPPTPQQLMASTAFTEKVKQFHKTGHSTPAAARKAEDEFDKSRKGQPVHLMDIHLEKGMHCADCHFVQDVHGNTRLHMEVRAATEILCIDCHGTAKDYATLHTSGPASYTSSPDGKGRDLRAMRTAYGLPRFEVEDLGNGKKRVFQNSSVEKGLRWEVVQTKDTIDKTSPRYNEKAALAKTVRVENGQMKWGELPPDGKCAHQNDNMTCMACHSSWNPSCIGCHLPQRANVKMPILHADGGVTKNYTAYNFQTLRDDLYMLARDGTVTGNKINPARSSCAIHVGSYNGNRESIYYQQQTISAEGYGGTAFSTNVPHTVRGRGARETKQCTDCHLSANNDNNAWMASLLMQGTNYLNLIGKYTYVAAGEEGLFAVPVTEQAEPQAVFGSDLHKYAFPESYQKHVAAGGLLKTAHEHPGRDISKPFSSVDILQVQQRGEYLYAACGKHGVRLFDIAFIDDKAFAERITTGPVSPLGQKFYLETQDARYVAAPTTVAVDPTRTHMKENQEQPIHPLFGYMYIADACEGLILAGVASTIDGNPVNNFLKRALTFNPDGLLRGARFVQIVGHYAYVCCDAGLVVVDIDKPTEPTVTAVVGEDVLHHAHAVQVQFRYAYVVDEEGIKVLDTTDLAKPVAKGGIKLPDCHAIYLARTYAYVAAGARGLVILDITKPEEPKLETIFNAGGAMCEVHDVKLGITYTSEFAYVADGKNGLRVIQLTGPETPGNEGFSPRPTPKLVATFRVPNGGHVLGVSKGLDRDRAVDESGHQIGVFGRVGARPLNGEEQRKMYLRDGKAWFVTDDPKDPRYVDTRKK
jgi:hypothetical protein